jgi:hypothetical protein
MIQVDNDEQILKIELSDMGISNNENVVFNGDFLIGVEETKEAKNLALINVDEE